MIRICVCNGPWQLCTLTAALQTNDQADPSKNTPDDYLVIHGRPWQKPLRESMTRMATSLHNWKYIVDVEEALVTITSVAQLPQLSAILNKAGLPQEPNEVWLPSFNLPSPRIAAEIWKNAEICLYEEGLGSHIDRPQINYWKFFSSHIRQWLRHEFFKKAGLVRIYSLFMYYGRDYRNFLWEGGALPSHLKRTRKNFYVPNLSLPPVKFPKWIKSIPIAPSVLQSNLSIYKNAGEANVFIPQHPAKNVLFLGQPFSFQISREEELSLYSSAVSKLVKAGYHVIWKDHPRVKTPFIDEIIKISPQNISTLPDCSNIPVEALLPDLHLVFCVGINSSTLFYSRALYGIESFSIAKQCLPYFQHLPVFFEDMIFTMKYIPDLNEKLSQKQD